MIEDQNTTPNPEADDAQPPAAEAASAGGPANDEEAVFTDSIDVESALAAIASLNELAVDETEAETDADLESVSDDIDELILAESSDDIIDAVYEDVPQELPAHSADFAQPPLSKLYRGQAASIVPALLLIGSGGFLTWALFAQDIVLTVPLLGSLVVGALGLMLLAQWLTSGRWSRGSFFIGLLLLFCGGTIIFLTQASEFGLFNVWPLLLAAVGITFILTAIFTPPFDRRAFLIGLLFVVASAAAWLVTGQILQDNLLQILRQMWPVAVVLLLIVLLAPLMPRRID